MKLLKKVLVAFVATILVVNFTHSAPAPAPKPEPNPEPNPVPNPEPNPEPNPVANPEPNPEPNPMPNPEPNPEANPLPKPEPIPDPAPAPAPEPVAEAEPTLGVITVPSSTSLDNMGPWKLGNPGSAADSEPDPQPLELYESAPFGAGPYLRTIDLKRADEEPLLGVVGALENANLLN